MRAALAGNPNCGKTTLFNALTGSRQYVGNWPGVTVERKEGRLIFDTESRLTDLPGLYSMEPYSGEEAVAASYLQSGEADVILNIIDSCSLERGLYLTTQLIQTEAPVILVMNMTDELKKNGISIDYSILERRLGVRIFPISAAKGKKDAGLTALCRFLAAKIKTIPSCAQIPESDEERWRYIRALTAEAVTYSRQNVSFSDRVDAVITNRLVGIPLFFGMMSLIFTISFGKFGEWLTESLRYFTDIQLKAGIFALLDRIAAPELLYGLLGDGICSGAGSVLSFVPQLVLLFMMLSFLEDSGYMARAAFLMDPLLRKIGLTGKAFIPIALGFGCTVPAVMAARTLERERDRRLAVLLLPFISCSAKIPVYTLLVSVFFQKHKTLVIILIYIVGLVCAVVTGLLLRAFHLIPDGVPFIMELPPYRIPTLKNLLLSVWDKVKGFIYKTGTVIFTASIVVWLLQYFGFLELLGKWIAPLFHPSGFGNWRAAAALLSGLTAKEAIVSTLEIVCVDIGGVSNLFTPAQAMSFMVFVLLYAPCTAAMAAIRRTLGSWKKSAMNALFQCFAAYIVSIFVYLLCGMLI